MARKDELSKLAKILGRKIRPKPEEKPPASPNSP